MVLKLKITLRVVIILLSWTRCKTVSKWYTTRLPKRFFRTPGPWTKLFERFFLSLFNKHYITYERIATQIFEHIKSKTKIKFMCLL